MLMQLTYHKVASVPRSLECPTESSVSHGILSVPQSLERPMESWASHGVLSVPRSLKHPTDTTSVSRSHLLPMEI